MLTFHCVQTKALGSLIKNSLSWFNDLGSYRHSTVTFNISNSLNITSKVIPRRSVICFVNGIHHTLEDCRTVAAQLGEIFGEEVRAYYNPTSGSWLSDASRAGIELFMKPDDRVIAKELAMHLRQALKDVGKDGRVLHLAHSGGAILTYLAAKHHLSRSERSRIDIITFGGGRSITRKYFHGRLLNYYARNDPLLLVDSRAAALFRRARNLQLNTTYCEIRDDKHNTTFVFLEGLANNPIADHSMTGPTYSWAAKLEAIEYWKRINKQAPIANYWVRILRKKTAEVTGLHNFWSEILPTTIQQIENNSNKLGNRIKDMLSMKQFHYTKEKKYSDVNNKNITTQTYLELNDISVNDDDTIVDETILSSKVRSNSTKSLKKSEEKWSSFFDWSSFGSRTRQVISTSESGIINIIQSDLVITDTDNNNTLQNEKLIEFDSTGINVRNETFVESLESLSVDQLNSINSSRRFIPTKDPLIEDISENRDVVPLFIVEASKENDDNSISNVVNPLVEESLPKNESVMLPLSQQHVIADGEREFDNENHILLNTIISDQNIKITNNRYDDGDDCSNSTIDSSRGFLSDVELPIVTEENRQPQKKSFWNWFWPFKKDENIPTVIHESSYTFPTPIENDDTMNLSHTNLLSVVGESLTVAVVVSQSSEMDGDDDSSSVNNSIISTQDGDSSSSTIHSHQSFPSPAPHRSSYHSSYPDYNLSYVPLVPSCSPSVISVSPIQPSLSRYPTPSTSSSVKAPLIKVGTLSIFRIPPGGSTMWELDHDDVDGDEKVSSKVHSSVNEKDGEFVENDVNEFEEGEGVGEYDEVGEETDINEELEDNEEVDVSVDEIVEQVVNQESKNTTKVVLKVPRRKFLIFFGWIAFIPRLTGQFCLNILRMIFRLLIPRWPWKSAEQRQLNEGRLETTRQSDQAQPFSTQTRKLELAGTIFSSRPSTVNDIIEQNDGSDSHFVNTNMTPVKSVKSIRMITTPSRKKHPHHKRLRSKSYYQATPHIPVVTTDVSIIASNVLQSSLSNMNAPLTDSVNKYVTHQLKQLKQNNTNGQRSQQMYNFSRKSYPSSRKRFDHFQIESLFFQERPSLRQTITTTYHWSWNWCLPKTKISYPLVTGMK